MIRIAGILIITLSLISCKQDRSTTMNTDIKEKQKTITTLDIERAIIYEANIRQYSPEGSFEAFTKDIPELKKLGVKIIWVMPIFPISQVKRKAKGDLFASDIKDEEERKKYLGSYYAVSDFKKINPEFGTIKDFRKLVKTAHEHDMYVILDWVPNHTGWDHTWITTNPEFYTKNAQGDITDPLNPDGTKVGWADVADLNYDNQELREVMTQDMMHWIVNEDIDGFRCDMAGMVPLDFWEMAIPKLRDQKDIFMLAEAWEPHHMKDDLFDMAYSWDSHHTMNHIAQGKASVAAWDKRLKTIDELYEKEDILMNFVTNHDENSWAGSVSERMGKSAEAFTVLSYIAPGMPLIYSGQEYDLKHRLKFFEKDSIPKTKGNSWKLLEKLGNLKTNNPALHSGKNGGEYTRIKTSDDKNILAFSRVKEGNNIIYIANLTEDKINFTAEFSGTYVDFFSGETYIVTPEFMYQLTPWEFVLMTNN